MKKLKGIVAVAAVIVAIVLMLNINKKKMVEQTAAFSTDEKVSVMTMKVQKEEFNRNFTSNGVAKANSELNYVSEISGRIVEIYVDKGSRVAKGSKLLKVDTELLEADFKAAEAAYSALKKDEERFTHSYGAGGVSSQQLDNIRTQLIAAESRYTVSKWKLEHAVVTAPVAGTINMRFVEKGALIAPNTPLFEIVDNSRIKVQCNLPESRVRLVSVGQKVSATSNDANGRLFKGTVKSIGVKTDRGLNYPVEVVFENNPDLHAGMYLKVAFEEAGCSEGIFIPRKAVTGSVLAANVHVAEDGKARQRKVILGEMYGDRIEILEGLEEGEEIIVAGLMNVSDGSAIKIVNE